jgi:nicotinate-nucleotide--dimethylbenzimidazole phosphoribosyltransferase
VRRGSRNMLREAAMSEKEMAAAVGVGLMVAGAARDQGRRLIAVGEMGIGNTTAASAMTTALTGLGAATVTGRGTGVDEGAYRRKCGVVEAVVARHFAGAVMRPEAVEVLRCVGGLEIAAMTGLYLGAARHGIAAVCDGFISAAAAAVAVRIAPEVKGYLLAGHRSEEPGHAVLLGEMGLRPLLDLGMRLGEGTGAVLAIPLIEAALALYREMATFDSAHVSGATA